MLGIDKIKTTLWAFCIIATTSVIFISAEASTVSPTASFKGKLTGLAAPTHVVVLKCKIDEKRAYHSKGAILALPKHFSNSKVDVALVTGHGLTKNNECSISDFSGQSRDIIDTVFAKKYKPGTETDWAIVSFKRMKGKHIMRYGLKSSLANTDTLNNKNISFAQARGLPENNQNCQAKLVYIKVETDSRPYYSHNCHAIPGQSGSPITQNIDGKHELMGLHIGSIWTLRSPITGKPGKFNFFRPYDEEMSIEIETALSKMQKR